MDKKSTKAINIGRVVDQQALLHILFNNLPNHFIVIKNCRGEILAGNSTYLKRLKVDSIEKLAGKTDFDLFPEHVAAKFRKGDQLVINSGEPLLNIEEEHVLKSNVRGWFLTSKYPFYDENGNVNGLIAISLDISRRKHMEQDLVRERNLLRTLIDHLPNQIYVKDATSKFILLNSRCAQELNQPSTDSLTGKTDFDIFPRGMAERMKKEEDEIFSKGIPILNQQSEYVDRYGRKRYSMINKIPIRDSSSTVVGLLGINDDITGLKEEEKERHRILEKLHNSEKMEMIGQLAGGIAHDFNNQLGAVMGFADMIREGVPVEEAQEYAQYILSAVERASDLTRQLLAFARKGRYQSISLNIYQLLEQAVDIIRQGADKRVDVQLQSPALEVRTIGDPNQLQKAVLEVLMNALDAMPMGGKVVVSCGESESLPANCALFPEELHKGKFLYIKVKDTGIGMPEGIARRIFEPFFSTKPLSDRTGMGLAAVYGAVHNHKGAISIESEPDRGTDVTIYLPVLVEEFEELVIPSLPHKEGERTVLIVDDEEIIRKTLIAMLDKLGMKAIAYSNGRDALKLYKESWKEIDLVILDMIMPEMSGKEVFEKLKTINSDVKAILCSGYSLEEEARAMFECGVRCFIQKPFQLAGLAEAVGKALSEPQ